MRQQVDSDAEPDSRHDSEPERSAGLVTVLIALGANLLVALAKTVAALLTGSASMVAEAAHSWADTGNEVFLLIAERRSARERDALHPQGYGKEAYIWSMFAAFGLFAAGAIVSIQHGISSLRDPEPAGDFFIAYLVLAFSFVLEAISFRRAFLQARDSARESHLSILRQVLSGSSPTVRAVFFEDAAALAGLLLAFVGILARQLTGSAIPDAVGSILVGVLLGVVAVVLIDRNRQFLLGVSIDADTRLEVIERLRSRPDIDRITYLHIEYVGPDQLFVIAAVDLAGNQTEDLVSRQLRAIEHRIEEEPNVFEAVLTLSAPDDVSL